jgi:multisubunit Na+/H+ antiporter MnhE subunit
MILLISLVCSLAIFGFWMNIVGNPHVVETVLGLVIAITVGVLVNRSLKKLFSKKEK